MTGTNHSLTGSLIASILPTPLAIPAAFVSHFILDSLPHFGELYEKRNRLSHTIWALDISLAVIFNLYLLINQHWLMLACSITAISPDFLWIYRFAIQEKFGKLPPQARGAFNRFHVGIQKFESRWGLVVEVVWAITIFSALRNWL